MATTVYEREIGVAVIDFNDFIDGCRSYMSLIFDIDFVFKRR